MGKGQLNPCVVRGNMVIEVRSERVELLEIILKISLLIDSGGSSRIRSGPDKFSVRDALASTAVKTVHYITQSIIIKRLNFYNGKIISV